MGARTENCSAWGGSNDERRQFFEPDRVQLSTDEALSVVQGASDCDKQVFVLLSLGMSIERERGGGGGAPNEIFSKDVP